MKRHLLFLWLLLPLSVYASTVTKRFYNFEERTTNSYYLAENDFAASGLYVMGVGVSGMDGYVRVNSRETFQKVVSVTVCCGVSEWLNAYGGVASAATLYVNDQSVELQTQPYRTESDITTDDFSFTVNQEDTDVDIEIEVNNGAVAVKIDYVEVTYEEPDPIWLSVGGVIVTDDNRLDVFQDGGSVQYDGRGLLVLNQAVVNGPVTTLLDHLTVFLIGTSRVTATTSALTGNNGVLTITTEGNRPGKLILSNPDAEGTIVGFSSVSYEQNLTVLSGSIAGSAIEIGTPVRPIVATDGTENIVVVSGADDMSNTVIRNVLYTLDKNNDDHYDAADQCIALSTTMHDDDVSQIVTAYQPGTAAFAQHFAGLTFMVPAGYGHLMVNARTGQEGVVHVKVGSQEPYVITGADDFTDFEFPYACDEATYVFVYSNSPVVAVNDHRAGKKTTVTVGIGSLGVSAGLVQPSGNSAGVVTGEVADVVLTAADVDYDADSQTLTVTNQQVNTLPEGAFAAYPYLNYIDLSRTAVRGCSVSRSQGAFQGVSKNTFLYLPAGNSTAEPNVIVGSVCDRVVLDGQMQPADGNAFGLAGSFMARQIVYDRPFAAGEHAVVCLPFAVADASAAGTFYTFYGLNEGLALLSPVEGAVEAHVPYVFKAAAAGVQLKAAYVMMGQGAPVAPLADGLYGTYRYLDYATQSAGTYRLVTADGTVAFQQLQEGDFIRPFEGFLYAPAEETVRLEVADVTAIRSVTAAGCPAATGWYTLNGQRLASRPPGKGIYIRHGRKVVL